MTYRARAEFDPARFGIRLTVGRPLDEFRTLVVQWDAPSATEIRNTEEAPSDSWLHLDDDIARAMYEALADYFGHSGHDTRALRKDYDAERARVDKLIAHLTGANR